MKVSKNRKGVDRSTGLIAWVKEVGGHNKVLIVRDEKRILEIEKENDSLKGTGRLLTLRSFMQRSGALPNGTQVSIDEVDIVMQNLTRHKVHNLTFSGIDKSYR